jgi:hypothetical protein
LVRAFPYLVTGIFLVYGYMGFIFSSASLYLRKIAYNFSCSSGSAAVVVGYGHLGDGNVHLNVSAREYDNQVLFLFLFH